MSIIKAFLGRRTVMRCFYLISFILLLATCRNEAASPDVYQVTFYNHYFEILKSVEIEAVISLIGSKQTVQIILTKNGELKMS